VATFTRNDVQRLARLARLELNDDEIDLFTRQLGDILEFARQVEAVDTTSVATLVHPVSNVDALREDVVQPSIDRDEVLAGAPGADRTGGLFKVPRVLNG
jgi:aspartyl-tRNA(Asn)/glutamyl-tRNA(Gln) amidotransferase subunit C